MLPKPPPRTGQVGFLYLPPYRVQGISIAGEQTVVQVPELDVCFDIGLCPRIALASPHIALSHAHMDHIGGLPYYFSQRMFQKMGVGTVIVHEQLAEPVERMMQSWIALENQRTQHKIIAVSSDEEVSIKNNISLKAIEVSHTVPALGFSAIEHRSKLRDEFHGRSQEELRDLKKQGTEITHVLKIPLVSYTGDTELSPALFRDEFAQAKTVITECTFFEDDHRERARVGKHLHVDDLAQLLDVWQAEHVVLVHLSRRTHMGLAREQLSRRIGDERAQRVHFLMDHRVNRARYERQLQAMEAHNTSIVEPSTV